MHHAVCTATTSMPPGRPTTVANEQLEVLSIVYSRNIAVMQGQNVKNRPSKHIEYYSFDFAFAVSSTAFLNAPRSAVS